MPASRHRALLVALVLPLALVAWAVVALQAVAQRPDTFTIFLPNVEKGAHGGVSAQVAPAIVVQPPGYDFGVAPVGTTVTATLTISNAGSAPLVVRDYSWGEFADPSFHVGASFTLPLTVAVGARTALPIAFAPTSPGEHKATLTLYSNDPQRPSVPIVLTGRTAPPEPVDLFEDDPEARNDWIYGQRAYPNATTPPNARLLAWEYIQRMKSVPVPRKSDVVPGSQWEGIGPTNIGGRVNSIAVNPAAPNTLYVGAAQGGVWKTTDDGVTWTPTTDKQPTTAMGFIAIDPTNANTLYAGTGEPHGNFDAYFGVGVLKSTDAGATWARAGNSPTKAIDTLVIDPTNTQIIWTAGRPDNNGNGGGVYKSSDGGGTWNLSTAGTSANAKDLVMDPTNHLRLFAAFAGDGIYRTTDGATWTRLAGGLPLASGGSRVSATDKRLTAVGGFAAGSVVAAGDADVGPVLIGFNGNEFHIDGDGNSVYTPGEAMYRDNAGHCVNPATCKVQAGDTRLTAVGAFAAGSVVAGGDSDIGTAWIGFQGREMHVDPDTNNAYTPGEGIYRDSAFGRAALAMAPSSPNTLYAGFEPQPYTIYKSTDGGNNWTEVPNAPQRCDGQCWYNNVLAVKPNDPNTVYLGQVPVYRSTDGGATWTDISAGGSGVHADQHRITFKPGDPNTLYLGNDGGVFKSSDGGTTWAKKDIGMAISQFMGVGLHPTAASPGYGGLQDNGEIKYTGTSSWTALPCCGDAGTTFVDPATPSTVYGQYVNFLPLKSTNSGASWSVINTGLPGSPGVPKEGANFYTPQAIDSINTSNLVAGATNVWRTTNGGGVWASIGGAFAGTNLSALTIDRATPTAGIWAGASNGQVEVTTNNGGAWTNVTTYNDGTCAGGARCKSLPNRFVTRIAVHPNDPQTAYVTYSGFNSATPAAPGHVFKTSNQGQTWTNISSNLPDLPQNAIVIDARSTPATLWLGSDIGIFRSIDDGASWQVVDAGLPDTAIFDLQMNQTGVLRAGTHGRGAFDLLVSGPELTVAKTLRALPGGVAKPGDSVTFDIRIANTGASAITRLPLDDIFDSRYLRFASASITPDAVIEGLAEWEDLARSAPLAPNSNTALNVTFTVIGCPADATSLNKARVQSAFNDTGAVVPTAVGTAAVPIACAQATLTKTRVGPQRVAQDETVDFDITIQNTGNLPISSLPLRDTFDPAALTFVSATIPPNSTTPAGTLTWNNLGPLAPGASVTVRVSFKASGCPVGQTTTDTARVTGAVATGPSGPITLATLTATASVDIACPALRVEKTLVPPVAGAITLDQVAVFNIRLTNQGNKTLRTIPLEDLFDPTALSFDSATPAPNAVGYGHLQWTDLTASGPNGFGADLTPGSSVTIVVRLRAVGCPANQDSVDKAKVAGAIDEEGNPVPPAEATATVKIACPRVAVEKKVIAPPCGVFGVNDPVPFTVTITNTGNSLLTVIPLADSYDPMFLGFVSATPSPDVTTPAGTLRWNDLTGPPPHGFGIDLTPGAHFTVNLTFRALASTSSQIGGVTVDTVTVAGATDNYGFVAPTATSSASVAIRDADLYIEKVQQNSYPEVQVNESVANTLGMSPFGPKLSNKVVLPGEIITYTVKYGNRGPDEAAFVKIQDVIPPGTIYLGHNLAPCVDGDIRSGCFVGRVAPGEKREFEVYVRVPRVTEAGFSTPPGTVLRDTITIASGFTAAGPVCGTPDSVPGNNTSTYDTTVLGDYGDAPASPVGSDLPGYGTAVTATYSGNYMHEWLGRAVSGERSATDGADIDAEANLAPFNSDHHDDGVFFRNPFATNLPTSQRTYLPAERAVTARVTLSVADPDHGRYAQSPDKRIYVTAWADSDKNGVFGDPGDQLLFEWNGGPGLLGTDGTVWPGGEPSRFMDLRIRVPGEIGWMMARVRLSYGAPPSMSGPMDYGEIEDYLIGVFPDGPPPQPPPGPVQPRPAAP